MSIGMNEQLDYDNLLTAACDEIRLADQIVIGAGAGLSSAAGLDLEIKAVRKVIPEYEKAFGITNLYEGSFYPFRTSGERFAYWSRVFHYWRYEIEVFPLYLDLLNLISGKDYFVITTNGDGLFLRANFPREKVFLMQGDHGDFACSESCCDEIYDARPILEQMIKHTKDFSVPEEYLPKCPNCGAPLIMRQRSTVRNMEIAPYRAEKERYEKFLGKAFGGHSKRLLLIEIGVGYNTPVLIKYPFWQMAAENENIHYICINMERPRLPEQIKDRSIYIQGPCDNTIRRLLDLKQTEKV